MLCSLHTLASGPPRSLPLTLHAFQRTKSPGDPHQSEFYMSGIQGYSLASLLLEFLPDMVTHLSRVHYSFFFFNPRSTYAARILLDFGISLF